MDWDDSPEQAAFRQDVRTFIQERLPEFYRKPREDDDPETDWQHDMSLGGPEAKAAAREWIDALAERGWSVPHWPKEYGGGGLSTVEQFIFKQELAYAPAPAVGGPIRSGTCGAAPG